MSFWESVKKNLKKGVKEGIEVVKGDTESMSFIGRFIRRWQSSVEQFTI